MRTSQRARALCPTHRTALAAALALAFGTTSAAAAILSVPSVTYPTLGSAVAQENAAADCSADTIQIAQGFVNSEPNPIFANCSGLTITALGTGARLDGAGLFVYGGASFGSTSPYCGIDSNAGSVSVDNLEITGFVYGGGLCGEFASVTNNRIYGNAWGIVVTGASTITNNSIGLDSAGNAFPGQLGIVLDSGDSAAVVSNNTVVGMQSGIQAGFMTGGQISNNTVRAASPNAAGIFGIGLSCSSGLQITGNSVSGQRSTGVILAETSATTLSGNTISGNLSDGIEIMSTNCALRGSASTDDKRAAPLSVMARVLTASSGNTLATNTITNNGGAGVAILPNSLSSNNLFESNTITGNKASGISIQDSASIDNAIIGNVIAGNTPKNIDLVSGANENIPSPQIQSVVQSGGNTTVTYQVLGPAGGAPYTIEFFTNLSASLPAGAAFQRQVFLPSVAGTQTFSEVFTGALDFFSLTSTLSTPSGGWIETSEFSPVGSAVVVAPTVTFSPVSTDFGGVYVHQRSDSNTVTVTNASSSAVTIGAPSLTGPFIIVSHDCPGVLPPGVSCSVNIVFAPASSGRASGTLAFASFSSTLTGSGLDAPILQSPALLDFGIFIAGSPALTQTASLTNTGSAAVTIDSILVSGPFTLTQDCPINLLPGASCTLTVGFSSSELGAAAGAVTIHSNALGGDHTIALGALVQATPEPVIEISPASLNFGDQLVGTQSPSMRVMILNSGGAAAILGPLTTGSEYVIVGSTCTTTLAAQATCTADIALDPAGFGPRHDALGFTGNAAHSPFSVGLDGRGCRPPTLIANRTGKPSDPCAQ